MRLSAILGLSLGAALLGGALGALADDRAPVMVTVAARAADDPGVVDRPLRRHVTVRDAPATIVAAVPAVTPAKIVPEAEPAPEISESLAGLPLVVQLVDGDAGSVLTDATVHLAEGRTSRERAAVQNPIPAVPYSGVFRAPATSAEPGGRLSANIEVEPPAGFVFGGHWPHATRSKKISPFARSLRATVPLRPAVEVNVDVRATSGHRITRRITGMSVSVGRVPFYPPRRPPHRVTVPFLRGETLTAIVTTAESWGRGEIALSEYQPRVDVDVRVPPRRREASSAGRSPSGTVSGCFGPDPEWEGSATLFVQVKLADGRCASGARIFVRRRGPGRIRSARRLEDDGSECFDRAPPGTYDIHVSERGMVSIATTVEVVADGRYDLRLVEPVGETAVITVVNHRGEPLPFAHVHVDDCGLARGAVQLLDHHTDAHGVCRVERLTAEPTDVTVHWAGRRAKATWQPGEPLTVTIPE